MNQINIYLQNIFCLSICHNPQKQIDFILLLLPIREFEVLRTRAEQYIDL